MAIISSTLKSVKDKCGLVPFITAGSPTIDVTEQAVKLLDQEGADVIEIGLPYSDPLADGPIIQKASKQALEQGVTLEIVLNTISKVYTKINAPIVLFTYYNPILSKGINIFLEQIAQSGVRGLIIPDLPLEEADYIADICQAWSIELILLVTPTSSMSRVEAVIEKSQGTIYIVSSTGVTGLRENVNQEMLDFVSKIRSRTDKSLILGFGISKVQHVETVANWSINGIVIGSAFVNRLANCDAYQGLQDVRRFCGSIKSVLRKV
uniref:Tryptophan synthase alpha chain n=1 Tax=Yamadaella caenomyce TaxID=259029 RepID=A0A1G4NYM8_9FLOR|nr:Tryptophan synthase alpha subunit [Yamadaella caenomyce]SCW23745.1 Tryptophan synthase alpha subunit [Yamadaella caenomyce]